MPKTSAYTLILPAEEWHDFKVLAAVRGSNIREELRTMIRREVDEARRAGRLPTDTPPRKKPAKKR